MGPRLVTFLAPRPWFRDGARALVGEGWFSRNAAWATDGFSPNSDERRGERECECECDCEGVIGSMNQVFALATCQERALLMLVEAREKHASKDSSWEAFVASGLVGSSIQRPPYSVQLACSALALEQRMIDVQRPGVWSGAGWSRSTDRRKSPGVTGDGGFRQSQRPETLVHLLFTVNSLAGGAWVADGTARMAPDSQSTGRDLDKARSALGVVESKTPRWQLMALGEGTDQPTVKRRPRIAR